MVKFSSRIAAITFIVAVLCFPLFAHANRGHGHEGASSEFQSIVHHAKDLGLTDEQVGKFKSLIAEHQKARIQGQANVNLAEVDVRALMRDDKADMAAIENAIRKSEAAQSAVRIETAKAIRTARTIFTPEQLQKWRATRATRHAEEQQPNQEAPKS